MSIRSLLMPMITQRLLSRDRLLKARVAAERRRLARREPHRVVYFHQVDDPYSALLASCLPGLLARYDIDLVAHVVGPPSDAAAPERARLVAYSRRDAQALAAHHGLIFQDPGQQPSVPAIKQATRRLVAAAQTGRFAELAGSVSAELWRSAMPHVPVPPLPRVSMAASADPTPTRHLPEADDRQTRAHLAAADSLRQRLGHYLGAMLHYAGEWYWGIDRLHHLEQRLQALGAQRPGVTGLLVEPEVDLDTALAPLDTPAIDFFFSLRSPYSAIVAPRLFELARLSGAPVRLRHVLPMVMRGLPVPPAKRMYISLDAAREAHLHNTPFGRLNDPVGRPTERGLALLPLAEREGKGQAYVLAFMHGVWAEGIDAGSDRGLRRIAERAGLHWDAARAALHDEGWRASAEVNRAELLGLGLWGVPSFRVRDLAVWGQDRLWAVRQELLRGNAFATTNTRPP
jgi:2-hydroxychromene-2-carboxylate isomerase